MIYNYTGLVIIACVMSLMQQKQKMDRQTSGVTALDYVMI